MDAINGDDNAIQGGCRVKHPELASITVGGLHHEAFVVEDAEMMASFHERAFGWTRMLDMAASTPEEAALWGGVFGINTAITFRAVMLEAPGPRCDGRVEYVQLTTTDGPGHVVLAGITVTSFRVSDIESAMSRIVKHGATVVQKPVALLLSGWDVKVGSVRDPSGGLIELVELC